eukprot:GHVS01065115.1.p2 GENE.GHVS01065115.1~~GHVS01065115.1.p2  ORF type:complete len:308 (+),score=66.52 GHVS01065115.1:740-1663(+)
MSVLSCVFFSVLLLGCSASPPPVAEVVGGMWDTAGETLASAVAGMDSVIEKASSKTVGKEALGGGVLEDIMASVVEKKQPLLSELLPKETNVLEMLSDMKEKKAGFAAELKEKLDAVMNDVVARRLLPVVRLQDGELRASSSDVDLPTVMHAFSNLVSIVNDGERQAHNAAVAKGGSAVDAMVDITGDSVQGAVERMGEMAKSVVEEASSLVGSGAARLSDGMNEQTDSLVSTGAELEDATRATMKDMTDSTVEMKTAFNEARSALLDEVNEVFTGAAVEASERSNMEGMCVYATRCCLLLPLWYIS